MSRRDLTVVIPHRGDAMGFWMACESVSIEADAAGIDYGFSVCSNGSDKLDPDSRQILAMLKQAKRLDYHYHNPEPMTAQMARQNAIDNTDSEIILCADNHIVCGRDSIKRGILDFEKYDCDSLRGGTQYYQQDVICYGYIIKPKVDGWGTSQTLLSNYYKPLKVACSGHGFAFYKRKSFNELNGYYLSSLCKNYASEEILYDISSWMQGKNIYLDPQIIHKHYASSSRGYSRHHTSDFFKNLFSSTLILTDETSDNYVYHMLEHFQKTAKPILTKPLYDILMEAEERSLPLIKWLRDRRLRTFEEQLKWFDENDVQYK